MNYKGTIVSGDFEENTLTIEMDNPVILKVGEYMVIPIEEFKQQIIDACKKGFGSTAVFRDKLAEQYYNEKFIQ